MISAIDARNQVLDHLDLVRHLGAAEDGHERAGRGFERLAEVLQLLLHQQPGAGRRHQPDQRFHRRVRAVGGAEGVVHVDVAQLARAAARRPRRSSLLRHGSGGSRAGRRRPRARPSPLSPPRDRRTRSRTSPGVRAARRAVSPRAPGSSRDWACPSGAPGATRGPRATRRPSARTRIVGSDSRMRVSSPITPPLSGTLKSTRMKTRRP